MTALLEAPASAPVAPPSGRRTGLLVLAVALAVGGLLASLTSLAPRAASFASVTPAVTGAPLVTLPEFGPRGSHILGYEHGSEVTLALPLHNDGRLPVTVRSVDIKGGPVPLLDVTAVEGLPLSLGPGDRATVTARAVLGNCRWFHERALETYPGVSVGLSSLGWSGTHLVAFDRPLMVKSPMLASCPDRKLNRQADRRSLLG